MKNFLLLACAIFCFQSSFAIPKDNDIEIGIIEQLNKQIPIDIMLTNEAGELVNLSAQIDKPTAIIFVYYRCPGICGPIMNGVADLVAKTQLEIGKDFQILTLGFDPREGTELAVKKKKNYQNQLAGIDIQKGWKFFTGDSLNIAKATQAMGFLYKKAGNDFTHAATMIIASPEGKITRYLNGTNFLPFEFKLAIAEATKGQVGPTINKILQYCYSYDPVGQAYVLNVTKLTGTIILAMGILIFLLLAFKKPYKKHQA